MIERIASPDVNTHMPFLVRDENGEPVLFYCRSDFTDFDVNMQSRRWKLWVVTELTEPRRINTRMSEGFTECAPTAWMGDGGWHVTFIAGNLRCGIRYQLYHMWGETLETLSMPIAVQMAEWGHVLRNRTVSGDIANVVRVREGRNGNFDLEFPGALIGRISYRPDQPDRLLIGCQWQKESEMMTIEYDIVTEEQWVLRCDGQHAYKCCILGDTVLYAKCGGKFTDDRTIVKATSFQRSSFKGIIKRREGQLLPDINTLAKAPSCGACFGTVDLGPAVRPSCLECVEKHIGAAYVLLAEERDGYAHRLRAVGHLHEAEDESQAWDSLHQAIRTARKSHQQQGIMPMWDVLQEAIDGVRQGIEVEELQKSKLS